MVEDESCAFSPELPRCVDVLPLAARHVPGASVRLHALELANFRGFQSVRLDLDGARTTALVGANGSGKSTVLDAIAFALSWLPARLRSVNGNGHRIDYDDIRNSELVARIQATASLSDGDPQSWTLGRAQQGSGETGDTDLSAIQAWAQQLGGKDLVEGRQTLPVLSYYPTNRVVLDIPARIRKRHAFNALSTYDEALESSSTQFRTFFEWFREHEDLENERRIDDQDHRDPQLTAVRAAIESLLPGYRDLRIRRAPQRMEVRKNDVLLRVDQLSDGEKCLLALAGDLALRLALANPGVDEPLAGPGIVLIDEVELHLHPAWQRVVLQRLEETFPGCQFIVSTHSPLVLSQIRPDAVWLLDPQAEPAARQLSTWGQDAERILEEALDTPSRPDWAQRKLDALFELLATHDLSGADASLAALDQELPNDPALVRARALRRRLERIGR